MQPVFVGVQRTVGICNEMSPSPIAPGVREPMFANMSDTGEMVKNSVSPG
jgi:hypothetical protein